MGDQILVKTESSSVYEAEGMLLESFSKLFEFYQKETLCDVVICVEHRTFKCHRVVLASCSPYFQAMFTSPLNESQQTSITIREIDAHTMEQFINFAYTAKITLDEWNAQSVLHASSVLQLDALEQACCAFIIARLHPINCLGIRQFADQHGLFELVKHCDNFAKLHFKEIIASEDFTLLEASHFQQLLSLDDLFVDSEEEVFEAIMKWMEVDYENRKASIADLMSCVRFPFLSLPYRRMKVETNILIRTDLQCRDLLDEARDYALWQAGKLPKTLLRMGKRMKPRDSYAGVLYCVGGRGSSGSPFKSAEFYSLHHNLWVRIADLTTSRRHVGCTSMKGKIYAIGGCNETEHLSSGEVFNPLTGLWSPIVPMALPRRGLGLCCFSGAIYAIGGMDDSTFYSNVERYDVNSDVWCQVAALNNARGGVTVAELNGILYAFGGNCGRNSLNTCEAYHPIVDKWTFIAPMNQCRAGSGAAVLDGFIYVVGGFENNMPVSSVERYDPENDKWTYVANMKTSRGGVGVAELSKKIYAIGGHNGSNYLETVEVYDPQKDKWSFTTCITVPRAGAGVCWCPCKVDDMAINMECEK